MDLVDDLDLDLLRGPSFIYESMPDWDNMSDKERFITADEQLGLTDGSAHQSKDSNNHELNHYLVGESLCPKEFVDWSPDFELPHGKEVESSLFQTTPLSPPSMISNASNTTFSSSDSTPMTPGIMTDIFRSTFPRISQKKAEVLTDAFIRNPAPTAEQSSFLAQSLQLDEDILKAWHKKHRLWELTIKRKNSRRGTLLKSGLIAVWRRRIIERGLQANPDPSSQQIEFLVSGLRISTKQFWDCQKDFTHLKADMDLEKEPRIQGRTSSANHIATLEQRQLVRPWGTNIGSRELDLLGIGSTIGQTQTGQTHSTTKAPPQGPAQSLETCIMSSPCLSGKATLDGNIDLTPDCNDGQSELDSEEDNDDQDITLEEAVAADLGSDFAHHAQLMIDSFHTWKIQQLAGDTSHSGSSGMGSTPASSTSQPTSQSSPPDSQYSCISSGKRKASGDGSDPNDPGDDEDKGRPPKKPKKDYSRKLLQVRWDCPIERRAIGKGNCAKSRGCAPNGLEFRNIWEHLRQAHYGCENCGKKLAEKNADMKHMLEKGTDPTTCTPGLYPGQSFDIGCAMYQKLADIYNRRGKDAPSPQEKWGEWWKLFSPGEQIAPDGRHQGTISISTANIPAMQQMFQNSWFKEVEMGNLPLLDISQMLRACGLLDGLLRAYPTIERIRRQRTQPQTPQALTFAQEHYVANASGQSPSLNAVYCPQSHGTRLWSPQNMNSDEIANLFIDPDILGDN